MKPERRFAGKWKPKSEAVRSERMPTVIVTVLIAAGAQALLLKRKDSGMWEAPGRRMNFGEYMAVTGAQSVLDETAIRCSPGQLRFSSMVETITPQRHFLFIYFTLSLPERPVHVYMRGDSHSESMWFGSDEFPPERAAGLKRAMGIAFGGGGEKSQSPKRAP